MISDDRLNKLKRINIRLILDDFRIPRTEVNCNCPNPLHKDNHPSAVISDIGYDKKGKYHDHYSVYCYSEDIRWDNINLYILLKGYDPQKQFIKAVFEMEKRYLNEDHTLEISQKRKIIKYDNSIGSSFGNVTEAHQYIRKLLNSQIDNFTVTKVDLSVPCSNSDILEYFQARYISFEKIIPYFVNSHISLYHLYDCKYHGNFILYVFDNSKDIFIIRKRIDKYLSKNAGKNIDSFKGVIGFPKPIWIIPKGITPISADKLIICEGMEDALSIIMNNVNSHSIIVSLNSTNQIYNFQNAIKAHINDFSHCIVILAFDRDKPGYKAFNNMKEFFIENGFVFSQSLFSYKFYSNSANDVNDDWIHLCKANNVNISIF